MRNRGLVYNVATYIQFTGITMKALFLGLLLSTNVLATSSSVSHLEAYAQPFPDERKLNDSIVLLSARLSASNYSQDFKLKVSEELSALSRSEKFLFIENQKMVGKDAFEESGAVTGEKAGDAIYFSRRVLKNSSKDLSRLVLHQVLHHLIPRALTRDEVFINALVGTVMDGKFDQRLQVAFGQGIHLRPGFVDAAQLFDYFIGRLDCRQFDFSQANCDERAKNAVAFILNYLKIPSVEGSANLYSDQVKLEDMMYAFGQAANHYLGIDSELGFAFDGPLKEIIKQAGLPDRWSTYPEPYCRRPHSSYSVYPLINGCRGKDKFSVKDIF